MPHEKERGPVLFVPAHPDDEVVGASAAIALLAQDIVFLHLTDGAPRDMFDATNYGFETREAYAAARRRELEAALAIAGVTPGQLATCGAMDQEASLELERLSRSLTGLLEEIRPSAVWTHPYEGGHPDHDAAAFVVHAAFRMLRERGRKPPRLVEFTSYHASSDGGVALFEFLPAGGCPETCVALSPAECERKRRMIECFETQRATLAMFPVGIERRRPAPAYDFRRPPHQGPCHYDRYSWGTKSDRWRALAAGALDALGFDGPL